MNFKTAFFLIVSIYILTCISCDKEPVHKIYIDPYDIEYDQYGSPFTGVPEIEDIIMYEVNLRAFSASGDFQGVIARLDDIAALGTNVIWLMPIYPVGVLNGINSPYCVRDYKAVSPEYGTLDDLRQLTDAAHYRGMAVMLDWVANHTSWDNEWIEKPSWYTQDANGNIVHPPGTNWMDVADLNYDNTTMQSAMIDAMHYWIFNANIDGFRCDYADGVPYDFWEKAWGKIHEIPERKFILFAEGARADHFDAGFDLNFSWTFYGALKDVFNGQSVSKLFDAQHQEYNGLAPGKHWLHFTTNHDESAWDATPVALFNGLDGALAASVACVFTGGVPLIYSGQEVGTKENIPFFSNSEIDWDNNPEMKSTYERMLTFYAISNASKIGTEEIFEDDDVLCIKKSFEQDEVLILVNCRNESQSFDVPLELQNSQWTNIMTMEIFTIQSQLTFQPYQFYILN